MWQTTVLAKAPFHVPGRALLQVPGRAITQVPGRALLQVPGRAITQALGRALTVLPPFGGLEELLDLTLTVPSSATVHLPSGSCRVFIWIVFCLFAKKYTNPSMILFEGECTCSSPPTSIVSDEAALIRPSCCVTSCNLHYAPADLGPLCHVGPHYISQTDITNGICLDDDVWCVPLGIHQPGDDVWPRLGSHSILDVDLDVILDIDV